MFRLIFELICELKSKETQIYIFPLSFDFFFFLRLLQHQNKINSSNKRDNECGTKKKLWRVQRKNVLRWKISSNFSLLNSKVISMPHNLLDGCSHFITFLNLLTQHCLIISCLTGCDEIKILMWIHHISCQLSALIWIANATTLNNFFSFCFGR